MRPTTRTILNDTVQSLYANDDSGSSKYLLRWLVLARQLRLDCSVPTDGKISSA